MLGGPGTGQGPALVSISHTKLLTPTVIYLALTSFLSVPTRSYTVKPAGYEFQPFKC